MPAANAAKRSRLPPERSHGTFALSKSGRRNVEAVHSLHADLWNSVPAPPFSAKYVENPS